MTSFSLRFLGAVGTVTGSKTLLRHGERRVLVDCGLFQGYKQLRLRNWRPPGADLMHLDAVLLTHAHIDHSGYLPALVKNGYTGPIHCTEGTYDLWKIMLPDSARLQEEEAENANRYGWSKHERAEPLYTEKDARLALQRFQPHPAGSVFELPSGLRVQMARAGHILGSSLLRLSSDTCSVLFSGDLGRPDDPIMRPPETPEAADYVVVESTYGNRRHPDESPRQQLRDAILSTVKRGGVNIVPAFAVGRTQALLHAIHELKAADEIPAHLPVYLNSPMAINVTEVYRRHHAEHRLDAEQSQQMCAAATYVNSIQESMDLDRLNGPMIIIAGSGMATGGRVVHHLKRFAPDPKNMILLTGYQAGGTRGARLQQGAEEIKIHGRYIPVRAEVRTLENFSAHADYVEIVDWLRGFSRAPKQCFINHGEPDAADSMRLHIQDSLGWNCRVPEHLEECPL